MSYVTPRLKRYIALIGNIALFEFTLSLGYGLAFIGIKTKS